MHPAQNLWISLPFSSVCPHLRNWRSASRMAAVAPRTRPPSRWQISYRITIVRLVEETLHKILRHHEQWGNLSMTSHKGCHTTALEYALCSMKFVREGQRKVVSLSSMIGTAIFPLLPSYFRLEQVLAEAARHIEAETQWYETLGLRYQEVAAGGGDLAVETVLAFNVVSGLIDAANQGVLAPVFVVLKGLLDAIQGAAAAREEIVELIRYCVGISRCLLEVAKGKDMPRSIVATLGEFKGEVEAVGRFVQTYGTRSSGCCRKMAFNSYDRDAAAGHKQRLKDLLDAVLAGLAVHTNGLAAQSSKLAAENNELAARNNELAVRNNELAVQNNELAFEVKIKVDAMRPPPLAELAEIPREAPVLPTTYVHRTAPFQGVVADLTDPERSASATHCLLGMGGGGKTLIASSVVRDENVRASFKDGVFWVPVGNRENEGKSVELLLESLAKRLAVVPTGRPHTCPNRFSGPEEALQHLSAVRAKNDLRCLVVLDNVWDVEVVSAFASTGFHVLVTTRQRAVIPPRHSGLCTEVGDMSEEDAVEVLRRASLAHGPLPPEEARKVLYRRKAATREATPVGIPIWCRKHGPVQHKPWGHHFFFGATCLEIFGDVAPVLPPWVAA